MFAKLSCSIYLAIRTRNQHHPYYHVKKALYFGTYHDATVHVSYKSSEPLKHAKLTCWTYSVLKMKHVKYHLVLLCQNWKKSQYEGPRFFVQHNSVTKTVKTNLLGGNDLFKRLLINFWNVCCFYHAERKSFPYRMFSFHFLLKRSQTF